MDPIPGEYLFFLYFFCFLPAPATFFFLSVGGVGGFFFGVGPMRLSVDLTAFLKSLLFVGSSAAHGQRP